MWSRPTTSCASCAPSATGTAFCWWWMKCNAGAGRTGKWWAIEHSGVEPDMVCMAKGIASGMPLGICMTRAEIMDWVPGSHASTFGGNPVSIAAALATMDIIEREGIANAARVGEHDAGAAAGWKQTHPLVGDVRGRGLMIGIELVKDKATREPAAALRNRVETLAFERGLMVLGCGETSLRLCPPLIVNEHEATVALDILEEALTLAEKEHALRGRTNGDDRINSFRIGTAHVGRTADSAAKECSSDERQRKRRLKTSAAVCGCPSRLFQPQKMLTFPLASHLPRFKLH